MSRRVTVLVALLALSLSVLAPLGAAQGAQEHTDVYVVVMANDPVITYDGHVSGFAATKPAKGEKADKDDLDVKRYEKYLRVRQNAALATAGLSADAKINTFSFALSGFSAELTDAEAASLARHPDVASVQRDELRQLHTDSSGDFLGLSAKKGPWAKGYDGEGVVVGVIDTGIWPEHPSFADDGSFAAPPTGALPCEFGNTAWEPTDTPFTCNNKLIGARDMRARYNFFVGPELYDSARDADGHGTHTTSTAAGNSDVAADIFGIPRGIVSGVAPRAHVVMYKACGDLGCFGGDLADAIDQAVADGVDVINYSIGGGASLTGPDDIAFLFAADAGVFAATSAGNSGPGAATVGSPASVPWITSVGASTQDRTFQGAAVLGDGSEFSGASITAGVGPATLVDAADHGNELCDPAVTFTPAISGDIVLCLRGAFARVAKSEAVAAAGGVGMILYNANDAQSQVTDNHFVPSVHTNNTDGLAVKAYIAAEGAAATAIVNGGVLTPIPGSSMAAFSSRGPNPVAGDLIKPDITAPGVNILAGNSPTPSLGAPGELFQSISGTSMSSPHVAGVFALLKQAHPDWTPAMAKSAIMTTARQDVVKEDGTTAADPFDMGAGHLNPLGKTFEAAEWEDEDDGDDGDDGDHGDDEGLERELAEGNVKKKGTAFNPGLVYDAGLFEYAAFTCGADLGVFTPGSCAFLESIGVPMDASDLNLPSIGIAELPGSQIVTRVVTNVSKNTVAVEAKVEAPAGYEVNVFPKKLRVKAGESAVFAVEISNTGAPLGEWRFGSLTWKGGDHLVRSPIAVRAVAFDAPDEVSGAGTSGTASFDVSFGYTGAYTAAAEGLVGTTGTPGTVLQDPNQDFAPSDVGAGGATAHTFDLTGASYARWELALASDDDLDVFLADPGGTIIASSTNGLTDEQIELVMPAPGIYTLYVHGWSVVSASPLPYTLDSWVVPSGGGGSLSVTGAPASATLGATGTVDVSWSGLAPGDQHYGVVTHSDGAGPLGVTVIGVGS
ncbi:MAG: S8 family peptidase [Acidimicrobiia bacterium]